ncbi:MAG: 3'-5' exonuclease [Pyrinomonadaceae bacterium]
MNNIRNIWKNVWIFDAEWVPCLDTGRRVLGLGADVPDDEVLKAMYAAAGATEANRTPMLKGVMTRVVSIAAVLRSIGPNGEVKQRLFSIPEDDDFDEAKILRRFLSAVGDQQPQLVGFASHGFDLPTLYQRSIVHGIPLSKFCWRPEKPWDPQPDYFSKVNEGNIDLMEVVGGFFGNAKPKLEQIAKACAIPAKVGGDGASVAQMWTDGRRREIVNYNECDALTTYLLWLQCVLVNGLLSPEEVAAEQTVVASWLVEECKTKPHLQLFLDAWADLANPGGEPMEAGPAVAKTPAGNEGAQPDLEAQLIINAAMCSCPDPCMADVHRESRPAVEVPPPAECPPGCEHFHFLQGKEREAFDLGMFDGETGAEAQPPPAYDEPLKRVYRVGFSAGQRARENAQAEVTA